MNNKKYSRIFIPRTSSYLWIILILLVVITWLDWRIAIPGYLLFIALVIYNFRANCRRQRDIAKYIENLTFNIDSASKDTLLNFPMPLVVVELDGTIIWYNQKFRKIFNGEQLLENTISSFVAELHPYSLLNNQTNILREIKINETYYKVMGNFIKIQGRTDVTDYILLLYFLDNTEIVELKTKYNEEKPVTGIIIIDNYDELMQSMEDVARPQILAEIDKKIVQWMGFTGGILKKFERDKYLFLFEYKYLKDFEDKKFEILDTVKEINVGNKIPVTLSIGLGINNGTLSQNLAAASAAIDLALGRGGDQVVLNNKNSFKFYGGKTRELEKHTRVKARVISYALRELIDQCSQVMIMGHENPDIDAIGAALGIYRIAKSRNKDAYIVLSQSNPTIDSMLARIEKTQEYNNLFLERGEALNRINGKTLLIIVDTYRTKYTEYPELLKYTNQVVVIDHHRRGTDYIQDATLVYQEIYASSTCELVTEIIQYVDEKLKLKPVEAEALYAGIVMDTKWFTFKTGIRTFEAASFLKKQGVDPLSVRQLFQNDLSTFLNISAIVRDAEIMENSIAISICPPNIKNTLLTAAKAADELLSLSGIIAAFVLCSVNNGVSISGRSLGELNVQVVLEKLGGGGHQTVAGAQLQDISVNEAKEKLKHAIIEYISETNNNG
ncbi:MAG: DHH family phosphoesterase [Firmicutes bacterium]|nr:DHH family phosphoesterase [Bacillota bacterium]